MHTKEIKPVVGRLYKLDYNGTTRVALVNDYDGLYLYAYDFLRQGPRTYMESKIRNAEEVTDKSLVLPETDWTNSLKEKLSRVYRVFVDGDDTLYAVNI